MFCLQEFPLVCHQTFSRIKLSVRPRRGKKRKKSTDQNFLCVWMNRCVSGLQSLEPTGYRCVVSQFGFNKWRSSFVHRAYTDLVRSGEERPSVLFFVFFFPPSSTWSHDPAWKRPPAVASRSPAGPLRLHPAARNWTCHRASGRLLDRKSRWVSRVVCFVLPMMR